MTHDLHTLTGAYALDALDDDERGEFEQHLQTCEACAEEVRGLRATGARLAAATAVQPPQSFHDSVLAQVRATRQLTPLPAPQDASAGATLLRRARSQSRALMAVAAALIVVAGALGAVAVSEQRRATRVEQAAEQVAAVLGAPDARTLTAAGPSGSSARVVVSQQLGRAVFVPHAMSAAEGRDLQLWVIRDGAARSAGLVRDGQPIVASGVTASAVLGVTVEPEGGSDQPTSAPVMKVPLT
jgi:anti-sigma-K factor RskA